MKTYQHKIILEDLISRVPGLFPSMKVNEDGCMGSIMTADNYPNGCWGNVVPDLLSLTFKDKTISAFTKEEEKEREELAEKEGLTEEEMLKRGKSYRTLMNQYYSGNEEVKEFVEIGLGKRYFKDYYAGDYDAFMTEHYETPSMVYLASVKTLLKEYEYYHDLCVCHDRDKALYDKKTRQQICCICEKYELRGGDTFYEWLQELSNEPIPSFIYTDSAYSNISVMLSSSITDLGIYDLYENRWVAGRRYVEGEIVTYKDPITLIDDSYVCVKENGSEGYYDADREMTFFPITGNCPDNNICFQKINDEVNIIMDYYEEGVPNDDYNENRLTSFETDITNKSSLYTESNLKAVRRSKSYLNSRQMVEYPQEGEDWLFYYRKGTVNNIQTIQDELGNISVFGERKKGNDKPTETNLYAYGDVLTNIEVEDDRVIFEYVLGGHLKAVLVNTEIDIDGNEIYHYDKFEYDEDDIYHGIRYRETHRINTDDPDWIKWKENNDLDYLKCSFYESSERSIVVMEDYDNIVSYVAELAEYEFTNKAKQDYLHSPLMRNDSMIGISYKPKLDIDIYISRGNAAAFEKHIKLSEVKTMEDLENYSNGSFFNIQNLE